MSGPIIPITPRAADAARTTVVTAFNRRELSTILSVYGRRVAAGAWRDYAIGHGRDAAVFAVFRSSGEAPLYRIEKRPALAARQGAYSLHAVDGRILKRGRELKAVLDPLERKWLKLTLRDAAD
ncbi:MAG: DUF2794 domain-containing protein [Pseudomonadota bacterium]